MAMTPAERVRKFRERQRNLPPNREIKPFNPSATRDSHGMSGTPEYETWQNMIRRCYDETHTRYEDYGGRGISVCKRWLASFRNFYEDMGPCNGLTLDRIDNNKNYEKSNCKWATYVAQARNKSNNRHLTYNGETMLITDWSRKTGIKLTTLFLRLERGWSIEAALNTKPRPVGDPNSPGAIRQRQYRQRITSL